MKNLALTSLLLLSFVAFGQSNFNIGFKEGFKNGYCYSNNQSGYYCNPPLPPLPPLPQISERSNSYQDGYNRGFLYGQSQRTEDDNNSSKQRTITRRNPPTFNPYVPQLAVSGMVNAGISRQRLYDERKAWIQSRVDGLISAVEESVDEDSFPSVDISKAKIWLKAELIKYVESYNLRSSDFADNYQFQNIVNNFNNIERTISKRYTYMVDHEE